jgi:hypothetical protein
LQAFVTSDAHTFCFIEKRETMADDNYTDGQHPTLIDEASAGATTKLVTTKTIPVLSDNR